MNAPQGRAPTAATRGWKLALALIGALAVVNLALWLTGAEASAPSTHRGKTAQQWHTRYLKAHKALTRHGVMVRKLQRHIRQGRRAAVHRPSSLEAIRLAATAYRQSYGDLIRVADCESPGLSPTLVNGTSVWNGEHATGLFQFLPSTFRSTPYRSENIFSPYANALAAGWMWANGRRGEWACK